MIPSNLTGARFKAWRTKLGWSQTHAAKILGTGVASVRNYEKERRSDTNYKVKIPLLIAWACSAINAGLNPLSGDE